MLFSSIFLHETHISTFSCVLSLSHQHTFDYTVEYGKQQNRREKTTFSLDTSGAVKIFVYKVWKNETVWHTRWILEVLAPPVQPLFGYALEGRRTGIRIRRYTIIDAIMTFALAEWRKICRKTIIVSAVVCKYYTHEYSLSDVANFCRNSRKFIILLVKLDAICLKVETKFAALVRCCCFCCCCLCNILFIFQRNLHHRLARVSMRHSCNDLQAFPIFSYRFFLSLILILICYRQHRMSP